MIAIQATIEGSDATTGFATPIHRDLMLLVEKYLSDLHAICTNNRLFADDLAVLNRLISLFRSRTRAFPGHFSTLDKALLVRLGYKD